MKRETLALLLFIVGLNVFAQTDTISLISESEDQIVIGNQFVEFYKDTTNSHVFSDVRTEEFDTLFKNPDNYSIIESNTNIWFRFQVKNQSDKLGQWMIGVSDFTFIDFFIVDQLGNFELIKAGTKRPASQKQIKSGIHELGSFYLNSGQTKTIYIKAVGEYAIKI